MLQSESVRLTALTEGDISQIVKWRNSFVLKRLTGSGPFMPVSESDVNIKSTASAIQFAIRPVDAEDLIGYVALVNIVWSNRTAELGIYIGDANMRGKGRGSSALALLLDYAFLELNLHRVQLEVVDYNTQAIRAYRQLGFTQEGARRQHDKQGF